MTREFVDVDVRPILRAGGEPFSAIMQALETLEPDQGMRLFATFKPMPLFGVMQSRGFSHEAYELEGGEWEVLFRPLAAAGAAMPLGPRGSEAAVWPEPVIELDNRGLDPPEPMVRILEATERLQPGEVLSAMLLREPLFLYPELAKRGHEWRGGFDLQRAAYTILIRVDATKAAQE
ncbi:DUF2249 domain-containing protein [Bradyrhizobium canariense]|uniref:Uncharacterized conserved protein n=1 Tax=Bradyrhizobium canariense TaxID=255045 RepID=A0A1H2BGS6_9BRAD|nr:DUF2249 domain-containing protein [Bradyrhizobium canariense]SDT57099.1 Uncharacterized conserved protein [Bradyrhizobium canariense]